MSALILLVWLVPGSLCSLIHMVNASRHRQWDEMTPYTAIGIGVVWPIALAHDIYRTLRDR